MNWPACVGTDDTLLTYRSWYNEKMSGGSACKGNVYKAPKPAYLPWGGVGWQYSM